MLKFCFLFILYQFLVLFPIANYYFFIWWPFFNIWRVFCVYNCNLLKNSKIFEKYGDIISFLFFFNNFTTISRVSRISRRVMYAICKQLIITVLDENIDRSPYTIDFIYKNSENVHKTVYSQYFWTSGKPVIILIKLHIIVTTESDQFQHSLKDSHFAIFFKNYTYFSDEQSSITLKHVILHVLFFEYQFNVKWWKEVKSAKFWTSNLVKFVFGWWFWTYTSDWTF